MITEKCTLPIGIEYEGKVHRDVEMRPSLVRDSIDAVEDDRAQRNESYLGLVILSKQIVSLGAIPHDRITQELLMGMYEPDLVAIRNASERLKNRLQSFRGSDAGAEGAGVGDAETGVSA
jgi:hypothetical protein